MVSCLGEKKKESLTEHNPILGGFKKRAALPELADDKNPQ